MFSLFRVSQALIMGTLTIANALAFTPNLQKGLTAASKVIRLINRMPEVTEAPGASEKLWVSAIDPREALKTLVFHFRVHLTSNMPLCSFPIRPDQRKKFSKG